MTKRTLLISIPIAALVLNGVGYLIVSKIRSPPATATIPRPTESSVPARAVGAGGPEGTVQDGDLSKEARALARRATGLAALEAGDYEKALINFTEARVLLGDKAHVDELLRVTEDLRAHPPRGRSAPAAAAPSPSPTRFAPRTSARRFALREEPTPEAPPPPQLAPAQVAAPSGLLIVTTNPRGVLVQVDETAVDLTPMRTKVKPGAHRITLLDGDRKVYETTLEVKDGATATLARDISVVERVPGEAPRTPAGQSPIAALPLPGEAPSRQGAVAGGTPEPPPAPKVEQSPSPQSQQLSATTLPAGSAPDGRGTGTLSVTSPGLYGVVWVDGRPRGYPPLEVRDLPVGPTKIEVRVNGLQKRASTVLVRPGTTTLVTMR